MIRPYAKWLVLLAAIGMLISVFVYNGQKLRAQENRPLPAKQEASITPDVGVIQVKTGLMLSMLKPLVLPSLDIR